MSSDDEPWISDDRLMVALWCGSVLVQLGVIAVLWFKGHQVAYGSITAVIVLLGVAVRVRRLHRRGRPAESRPDAPPLD